MILDEKVMVISLDIVENDRLLRLSVMIVIYI